MGGLRSGSWQPRYTLAGPYKTFERAELVLEDMYADGQVSGGEHPRIEYVGGSKPYVITVAGA